MKTIKTLSLIMLVFLMLGIKPINIKANNDYVVETNRIENADFIYCNDYLVLYKQSRIVKLINAITNKQIDWFEQTPFAKQYNQFLKSNNIIDDMKPIFIDNYMFYVDKSGMSCFDFKTGQLLWKNAKLYDRDYPRFIHEDRLYLDLNTWSYMSSGAEIKIVNLSDGEILDEFTPQIKKLTNYDMAVAWLGDDILLADNFIFYRYNIKDRKIVWETEYSVGTHYDTVTFANNRMFFLYELDYSKQCLSPVPMMKAIDLSNGQTIKTYFCDKFAHNNGYIYSSYCLYCDQKNGKISAYNIEKNTIEREKLISDYSNACFYQKILTWNNSLVLASEVDDYKHTKLSIIDKNDFSLKQSIVFKNSDLISTNQHEGMFFVTYFDREQKRYELVTYLEKDYYQKKLIEVIKDILRLLL